MSEIETIGHGHCPKCGGRTEIQRIISFPFPDDERTRTVENCLNPTCGFRLERDFSSTNAATTFDYWWKQDLRKRRVNEVIKELSDLISSYARYPCLNYRPNITLITRILASVQLADYPLLYVRLEELAGSELGSIRIDTEAEIMASARMDHALGQLTGGMADWYDNEMRALGTETEKERVIDCIKRLVIIAEQRKKTPHTGDPAHRV